METKATQAFSCFKTIDILVNNGGISQRSLVKDTVIAVDKRILEINYLGTVGETNWSWSEDLSPKTKLIVHSAAINFGNSGGPLFDKDGNLIGINSSGDPGGKFNIAVSVDHVTDLLKE